MLPIYQAAGVRAWDAYTMENEPISSTALMERAAGKAATWILQHLDFPGYCILAGSGNNGGDGIAIARILKDAGKEVELIRIFPSSFKHSHDFDYQWERRANLRTREEMAPEQFEPNPDWLLIDALYGTGFRLPMMPLATNWINIINALPNKILSIDLPSGMLADGVKTEDPIVNATITLSFQTPKPCLLLPETGPHAGHWEILPIGLHPGFATETPWAWWLEQGDLRLPDRPRFAHKGIMGHALLIGGSYGKAGAIMMAAEAALHSGVGLVSALAPSVCVDPLQTRLPQAMVLPGSAPHYLEDFSLLESKSRFDAIGIGPGLGTEKASARAFISSLKKCRTPLVIDADALNILSAWVQEKQKPPKLPPRTILTPHPLEFDRFFGKRMNGRQRLEKARRLASEYHCTIVLKGAYTVVVDKEGLCTYNPTGNPGMAKGGSGDVLTGIITALLAQGLNSRDAARTGVYLHGKAGDLAAARYGQDWFSARELINALAEAWKECRLYANAFPKPILR